MTTMATNSGIGIPVIPLPYLLHLHPHSQTCLSSKLSHPPLPLLLCTPTFNRSTKLSSFPIIKAHSASPDYVPDSKFYKVEAILRPWRVQQVSSALLKLGIRGVTVSDVRGFGAQGGSAERHAGSEFSEDSIVSKVKMEIVVSKDQT